MVVLLRGQYVGMDCTTFTFIDNTLAIGPSDIVRWENCCTYNYCRPVTQPTPALQHKSSVDIMACCTDEDAHVSFKDKEELSRVQA